MTSPMWSGATRMRQGPVGVMRNPNAEWQHQCLTVEAVTSMPVSRSPAYCFCNCKELLHCRGLSVRAKARLLGSLGDYSVPNIDKYGTDMPSYLCFRMDKPRDDLRGTGRMAVFPVPLIPESADAPNRRSRTYPSAAHRQGKNALHGVNRWTPMYIFLGRANQCAIPALKEPPLPMC